MKTDLKLKTKTAFSSFFQTEADVFVFAPGRINIIGEHLDYNHGFVLPAAIDRYFCFAARKNNTQNIRIFAVDLGQDETIDSSEKVSKTNRMWTNYLRGVLFQIQEKGFDVAGFDVAFSSTVPIGGGMSSSAAMECGFAFLCRHLFQLPISDLDIALMGQKAEHDFVGVRCGIMDQYASVFGKADHALLLDCDALSHTYVNATLTEHIWVLIDSRVKHTHLSSGYNTRREEMNEGWQIIKQKFPNLTSFRDLSITDFQTVVEDMSPKVAQRCLFVIQEIERVSKAVVALQAHDLTTVGTLLTATHKGLSEQYEVSCEELDFLVAAASQHPEVLGTRMMGGGFGGCTLNLIEKSAAQRVVAEITNRFEKQYGHQAEVYWVNISDGIHVDN